MTMSTPPKAKGKAKAKPKFAKAGGFGPSPPSPFSPRGNAAVVAEGGSVRGSGVGSSGSKESAKLGSVL
jgi:hypothetical protein